MVEVEHDRGHGTPLLRVVPLPGREQAIERDLEVSSIPQAGERVSDGRVGHALVERDVGQRQGDLGGDDRHGLELERRERSLEVGPAQADRADDLLLMDQGHDRDREDIGGLGAAHRRREIRPSQRRRRDDPSFGHGRARQPLPGRQADADVPRITAVDGDDPVLAAGRVAQDEGHDVGFECRGDAAHDRGMGGALLQAGVDGGAEGGQPGEQRGAREDRRAFGGQGHRRREPVADDHEGLAIVLVERRRPDPALDVENAQQDVPGLERDADLAAHVGAGRPIVGVGQDVGHEFGLAGPQHPTDHTAGRVERRDLPVVSTLGRDAHQAAIQRVDGHVAVVEPGGQEVDDGVEGILGRPILSEQSTDRLDRGHLPGTATLGLGRVLGVARGALERLDRSARPDAEDRGGRDEGDAAVQDPRRQVVRGEELGREHDRSGQRDQSDDDPRAVADRRGQDHDGHAQQDSGRLAASPVARLIPKMAASAMSSRAVSRTDRWRHRAPTPQSDLDREVGAARDRDHQRVVPERGHDHDDGDHDRQGEGDVRIAEASTDPALPISSHRLDSGRWRSCRR